MPVLYADGQPFVLKVWTAGLHLGSQTNVQVKAQMDWAAASDFNSVEIMAEWRYIEATRRNYDWSRIDDLMNYATTRGLRVLLTIEAGFAPPWFADTLYPNAIFVTYDPNPAAHPGMSSGKLSLAGVTSLPIFYHPDYWTEADAYFTAAINRYKAHPALFGYDLFVFATGEFNYPGSYLYNIAGFADYSDYTSSLYSSLSGSAPPKPIFEFSKVGPDTRADWIAWTRFRIEKKREALDHFGPLVKSLDSGHVLISWLGQSPLWGEWDGGLVAEGTGGDYTYQLTRPYVDVLRAAPQLTSDLFEVVWGKISFNPYLLLPTVQAVQRHGKVFLLQTERAPNSAAADLTGKITAWAEALQSLGVHFLWWQEPAGLTGAVSGQWTAAEKTEISNTLLLAAQPRPGRTTHADFAFVDLPFETSKYYTDNTWSLIYGMRQAQAFLDAGLPYETVSEDEILVDPTVLNKYKAVGLIFPDAYDQLAPAGLKTILNDFQAKGKYIWRGNPVDGFNYSSVSGYADTVYLDSLRTIYDTNNLKRHVYAGYDMQVWGNQPYLFVLSRSASFNGTFKASVAGWDLTDGPVTLTEVNGNQPIIAGTVTSGVLQVNMTLTLGKPYLFIVRR